MTIHAKSWQHLLWVVCLGLITITPAAAWAQTIELRNDGFVEGPSADASYQTGFVAGESAASRFIAPTPGWRLNQVKLLFGESGAAQSVTLRVFDDMAGGNGPGTELHAGSYQLTPVNLGLVTIDLTSLNLLVPAQFRVAIEFQHSGSPSVARDNDGNINATLNYFYTAFTGWAPSQNYGLSGDWVIRAIMERPAAIFSDSFEN